MTAGETLNQIKDLIARRHSMLSIFILEQAMARIDGERETLSDITEAKEYNEETDKQCLAFLKRPHTEWYIIGSSDRTYNVNEITIH
jgi:hypothetical protein